MDADEVYLPSRWKQRVYNALKRLSARGVLHGDPKKLLYWLPSDRVDVFHINKNAVLRKQRRHSARISKPRILTTPVKATPARTEVK